MRLVGVAAAVLVANAVAVPVLCGAIDAVWQDQAAVAGNYPECVSYYDSSNLDQTVDLDSNHPHMARFSACKRYGATIWACPTIREHEVDDGSESEQTEEENHESLMARGFYKRTPTTRWKLPGTRKREVIDDTESEQTEDANHEPRRAGSLCKRTFTAHWRCPGAGKREVDNSAEPEQTEEADHEPLIARRSCRRSSAITGWSCPGAGKREVQGTKGNNGNWPPHTREALVGIETALAASNVDAKVGRGLDVASKPPGNWPPHMRLDVADEE